MTWSITLERDELDRLTDFLAACPPLETRSDGVWVRHQGGLRIWECDSWPVVWQLHGAATTTDLAPRCVASRLLWHAVELAEKSATGTVTLSVPDDAVAVVENEIGSGIVDLPRPEHRPDIPRFVTPRAKAVVTGGALRDLLNRTRIRPVGTDTDATGATSVGVTDAKLFTYTTWDGVGGLTSSFTVPATVTGEDRIVVSPHAFLDLVKYLEADEDVTITFPASSGLPLLVDGHDFRASVARVPTGAERWWEDVGQALADACGRSVRPADHLRYEATYRELDLSVELCDTPSTTVRITTTISPDLGASHDVLTQLNALNARLISARAWVAADGWVIAGTDLPISALGELPARLAEFHAQVSGYGPCLEALEADA